MERELLTSPLFDSVGYDADQQIMEVLYNDDRLIHYVGVPPELFEEFMMNTVGAYEHYFDLYIDNGDFEKVVVDDGTPTQG
jgi:hypothetical protein